MSTQRLLIQLLTVALLAGCAAPTEPVTSASPAVTTEPPAAATLTPAAPAVTAPPTPAPSPPPEPTVSPTREATLPVLPHTTIDASTLGGKLLMGYQGWFSCPGDGSGIDGYYHWGDGSSPLAAASYRMDMWPDTSELAEDELCATAMVLPDGWPAQLFSSTHPNTVLRHFQWMSDYAIDGVFLQRFGSQLLDPPSRYQRNLLTPLVRDSAEAYGRTWAIMYDVTGADERPVDLVDLFIDDWRYLVDVLRVTDSPAYLHHRGLPLVAVWGLGFDDRPGTAAEAQELVAFFRDSPDPRYRATVMGGTPFHWRTLEPNARTDPSWADYYCALDVISPWTVGAYASPADVDFWRQAMTADIAAAAECGADFMPVVYPGHSYHNPDPTRPFNEFPRQGGRLYWHQVFSAIESGASMIYNAMFDEVDEGTAMFKVAETTADVPVGVAAVTMDTDGECLPSDWYLTLAGEASRMLRGEIELSPTIPIPPPVRDECPSAGAVRLQVSTTSDWTTIELDGLDIASVVLVSASDQVDQAEFDAQAGRLVLTQGLERAESGASVELMAELRVAAFDSDEVTVRIGRGNLGATRIRFLLADGDRWVEVDSRRWAGIADGEENVRTIRLPATSLGSP